MTREASTDTISQNHKNLKKESKKKKSKNLKIFGTKSFWEVFGGKFINNLFIMAYTIFPINILRLTDLCFSMLYMFH